MFISEKINEVNQVVIEQEDMVQIDIFSRKADSYVASIKALEQVACFIQKGSTEKTDDTVDKEKIITDDTVLSGVIMSIGMVTAMLSETQWCIKQTLKRSIDSSNSKEVFPVTLCGHT